MLRRIFEQLDDWVDKENRLAADEGLPQFKASEFRIVGQNALLQANLKLELAATVDLDTIDNTNPHIRAKLNELLRGEGMELDPLGNEIWMPAETEYADVFRGDWVTALRALPVYVLVSKAKHAAARNRPLIQQYIAREAPDEFFELCEKYEVDLTSLLRGPE